MKNLSYILFFFINIFSYAQQVTINGKADAYKGKEVEVFIFDDLISHHEIKQTSALINDTGGFSLSFNLPQTQKIFINIGKQRSYLFAEPGNTYNIFVPAPDSTSFVNPHLPSEMGLYFFNTDSLELNNLIIGFNQRMDDFWYKNYKAFVVSQGQTKLDSFKRTTIKDFSIVKNDYFKKHVEYTLASLEFGISQGKKNPETIYFTEKPILYYNYEYMQLFNAVFKQYLQKLAYMENGMDLIEQINEKGSYQGGMEKLQMLNPNLKNDSLRELVLLKGLMDAYYVPGFDRASILFVLNQLEETTTITEHKKIASNIKNSFSRLEKGKKAPEFQLHDKDGNIKGLSDFKGKYIYLDFWATWCGPCLKEMKIIPALKKKYGDQIVFISISVDEKETAMKNFLAKNPKYDWIFLYSGDGKLKEEYNIKAVPTYFLIGPDGNFVKSPAEMPSDGIEETFNKIIKSKEKKYNVGGK